MEHVLIRDLGLAAMLIIGLLLYGRRGRKHDR
jgi:hypothetical protein